MGHFLAAGLQACTSCCGVARHRTAQRSKRRHERRRGGRRRGSTLHRHPSLRPSQPKRLHTACLVAVHAGTACFTGASWQGGLTSAAVIAATQARPGVLPADLSARLGAEALLSRQLLDALLPAGLQPATGAPCARGRSSNSLVPVPAVPAGAQLMCAKQ